jgi:small-conductance mechanosensitive channel
MATTLGIADRMPWMRTKWSVSRVLSGIVYWLTLLFFIVAAAESVGLPGVAHWITRGIGYTPQLFAAVLIMVVGHALSGVLRDMLVSSASRLRREQSLLLARIFHPLILTVAGLVAADQLGLDVGLLASLVTIAAAAAFGGLAFAFGMGAGSTVENLFAIRELRRMYRLGERVRVGELEGVIVEFSSTSVLLDSQSGRVMIPGQVFGRQASVLLDRSDADHG